MSYNNPFNKPDYFQVNNYSDSDPNINVKIFVKKKKSRVPFEIFFSIFG